ncbi:hypothetical protein ONJ95_27085, partial [Salmonella enterica subsp. enterica serovar Virginia]|nr:hypothetical protein [Salmonella enterica subsp. enterica serovar Virginia]
MKAYGSLAKREKDEQQSSATTATGETPRIEGFTSRDGNVEFAPFSSQTWWLPGKRSLKSFSGTVTVTLVNDLGARISESYDVP